MTLAIAGAMLPIAGAAVEEVMEKRVLKLQLTVAITLAIGGSIFAGGLNLNDLYFGFGALFCLTAVVLFAGVTQATTHDLKVLSPIRQTTITFTGCFFIVVLAYMGSAVIGVQTLHIGLTGTMQINLLTLMVVVSTALAQLLWIWGAGGLGILLASIHMNGAPFYVMAIVVVLIEDQWDWNQAFGLALVGIAVFMAQPRKLFKLSTIRHH